MRKLFSLKTFFLVALAAGIGAAIALVVNQKKKFAGMSEEEIRAYLDQKLAGKMSEEQLTQIQDAVVSAVKGDLAAVETVADVAEEVVEEAEEASEGESEATWTVEGAEAAAEATE
ncbi:MAG: hypothetical protein ABFR89_08580 [Actinomycetota bacterium]